MSSQELCNKKFDLVYDIIAAIISLFDIITDLWILIQWYYQDRIIFFGISLSILILANFAYLLVFNIRYGDSYKFNPFTLCLCTCISLPIAPLLSFTFYVLHEWDNIPSCCSFLHIYKYQHRIDQSRSRQWMETKISRHIGFVMEAIMEAFPQCILQMIAIMYYNELNIVAVISIIISMLSVSSKSLIFCAASSINIKTMIFTWFYAVTDFFAIFFVLSFVFYTGDDINDDIIGILRNIWIYKMYIFTIPTCFICSIPIFIWGIGVVGYQLEINRRFYRYAISALFITPLWALGMILGTMILEIFCYTFIAYLVYKLSHGRIPSTKSASTWIKIVNWIKTKNGSFLSSSSDVLTRICCVNRQLLLMKNIDTELYQYLEKKEHSTQYKDVTYKSMNKVYSISLLRNRLSLMINYRYDLLQLFKIVIFVYYLLSRLVTLVFPFLVLILLGIDKKLNHGDLPLFQMIMLCVMLGMMLIMVILLLIIWREERIIFHILPKRSGLYAGIDDYLLKMIMAYYERLIIKPEIKDVLCKIFGNDIGLLLFEFMPFELEEEEHAKQLINKSGQYTQEIKSNIKDTMQHAMYRTQIV